MQELNGFNDAAKNEAEKKGGFPWIPLLAAAGLAAAAFLVIRKMQDDETSLASLDGALDQCDRAISQLDARMRGIDGQFVVG